MELRPRRPVNYSETKRRARKPPTMQSADASVRGQVEHEVQHQQAQEPAQRQPAQQHAQRQPAQEHAQEQVINNLVNQMEALATALVQVQAQLAVLQAQQRSHTDEQDAEYKNVDASSQQYDEAEVKAKTVTEAEANPATEVFPAATAILRALSHPSRALPKFDGKEGSSWTQFLFKFKAAVSADPQETWLNTLISSLDGPALEVAIRTCEEKNHETTFDDVTEALRAHFHLSRPDHSQSSTRSVRSQSDRHSDCEMRMFRFRRFLPVSFSFLLRFIVFVFSLQKTRHVGSFGTGGLRGRKPPNTARKQSQTRAVTWWTIL